MKVCPCQNSQQQTNVVVVIVVFSAAAGAPQLIEKRRKLKVKGKSALVVSCGCHRLNTARHVRLVVLLTTQALPRV